MKNEECDVALDNKFFSFLVQGGPATAFDLAAFWLSMIAPVKKSVNHSRTVESMRETGQEQLLFAAVLRIAANYCFHGSSLLTAVTETRV